MSGRMRFLLAAAVTAALLSVTATARAQEWENDVRVRIGTWVPSDLPTRAGILPGIEVRNLLAERDGIAYGFAYYSEEREDREILKVAGVPTSFTFRADVKIQPIQVSWYHIWPRAFVTWYGGAGGGLYLIDAFSGGYSLQAGLQIADYGDFRFLEDQTLFGVHVYGGVDFFPDSRWGAMAELRFHIVEESYSASEFSVGAILRF